MDLCELDPNQFVQLLYQVIVGNVAPISIGSGRTLISGIAILFDV
jgi:hypothetical protein